MVDSIVRFIVFLPVFSDTAELSGGSWGHYYFFSALQYGEKTQEPRFIKPEAEFGETILPVMLTPPLPANENSPLATTGGGSSVRLECSGTSSANTGREVIPTMAVFARMIVDIRSGTSIATKRTAQARMFLRGND